MTDALPELTEAEYMAIVQVLETWLQIKAKHQPRLTDEQRWFLRVLTPDLSHSALLRRMLMERKPPLDEPPPLSYSYPVYPDD